MENQMENRMKNRIESPMENEERNRTENVIGVYLLSGFLGSGKTTLLRNLLNESRRKGLKPAVLMNEAGDVNLDGLAVDASVPMAELLGGCICCTIKSDVGMELLNLAKRYRPDVVFIESTGIAQPLEIIDAVSETSLYERLELRGILTVVDAGHLLDRVRIGSGKTFKLMKEQIRASTLLLLNKADLVREEELRELEDLLREWNPRADVVVTVKCETDLSAIWDGAGDRSALDAARRQEDRERGEESGEERNGGGSPFRVLGSGGRDHDHVNVVTYYLPGPLDSTAFERFLQELPEGIYRAKGIVTFRDTASRFLFQYAYRESDFLRITPQKTVHDAAVFIGEGFSRSELIGRLEKLIANAEE
ncbi:CobW family GTP-binding protein [Cohnella xylanilytica]|nr:GTP-binding protein [Cohnella xylanilytica]